MTESSLFSLNNMETDVWSALQSSVNDFNHKEDIDFWAQSSLKRGAEDALGKIASKNGFTASNGFVDPPKNGNGFRALFGLQISLGYKVRYKATANIGYGQRYGDFGLTNSLHVAAYNGGLGVGVGKKNFTVDITAAVNLTAGGGHSTPLQSYSSNYNSPIPNLNNFQNSFSYGQLLTWNSNVNHNQFSLDDIQRQGMIGFRLGDFNVSSNNDTSMFYFGDGGDRSWTGGLTVSTPLFEVGFQDFSGKYTENGASETKLKELRQAIKNIKNSDLSKAEKAEKTALFDKQLSELTDNSLHTQNNYQRNLNKASTYFRINNNGNNATVDFIGDAWLQNFIHRSINDLRFDYQHQKTEVWRGKSY
ncbi:hypothetical protein [Psychroserpens sp. NJDZ02]|uniref:hypothetical protein n=1 Tax=Psychroserpens sp. NJDZ02 TaxID=2570561 RepID=UPI0010A93A22|nr:hypothetical protein [Psychroserpens sp. NJDZ02]QCE43068.1 hypothetical protein E9099_17130 [Psychroserpens sp. NJDZ02]